MSMSVHVPTGLGEGLIAALLRRTLSCFSSPGSRGAGRSTFSAGGSRACHAFRWFRAPS